MLFWRSFVVSIISCLFVFNVTFAKQSQVIELKGYLSEEVLEKAQALLVTSEVEKNGDLYVVLNSSSGNIQAVIDFVKKVYQYKKQNQASVVIYIDENAIGPSAMIPFLADSLYSSQFALWGDIPMGTEQIVPTHLLRSQLISLIDPKNALLKTVALGMVDPELIVVFDQSLMISSKESQNVANVIAGKAEALVLNQNQMAALHLIKSTQSLDSFKKEYHLEKTAKDHSVKLSDELQEDQDKAAGSFSEYIKFSKSEENKIGYIYVGDRSTPISQSTWIYIKSALDYYKKNRPNFIILELNTPGGEVFASQKISDLLHEIDVQDNIPVVAYIDNWAISAGAMLAYSCRFIISAKDGSMGAAEPVLMGQEGQMQSASEKINSALRTDFGNRAGFYDRDPNIAKAMVDKDIILVLRHGKIVKLENESQIHFKGPNPDKVITNKGKLLTLNAQEMENYGVANAVLSPKKLINITEKEKAKGRWPFSKELLSTSSFFETIPNATVDAYKMDWRTQFFATLATPMVSSLLMLGMLVGFYLEFNTPGFGVFGAIGITCLLLIIISNLSLDIASVLEVVLMLIGICLVTLELTMLPTGGVIGFIGVVFFIGGLFAVMLPGIENVDFEIDTQTLNAAGQEVLRRLAWFCATIVVGFGMIALLAQYIKPSLKGINRLVLAGSEQDAEKGYIAGATEDQLPVVGTKGVVTATLRPAGKIMIEETLYDAVTAGGFIEKGQEIVVEKLDGSVIVVNRVNE